MERQTYIVLRDENRRPKASVAEEAPGFRTRSLDSLFEDRPPQVSVAVESLSEAEADDLARDDTVSNVATAMRVQLIRPVEAGQDGGAGGGGSGENGDAGGIAPAAVADDWNLQAVGALATALDGSGVTVAVLDTGIDDAHPAFQSVTLVQKDFTGEGIVDQDGHGTHCAGTIFGRDVDGKRIGVARGVKRAMIGKVLGRDGGTTDMLFQAVQWAHQGGAEVISMSLGFDFPGYVKSLIDERGYSADRAASEGLRAYRDNLRLFDNLMRMLAADTIDRNPAVIVAASGNESQRLAEPPYTIGKSLPSDAAEILPVGAATPDDGQGHGIAPFSNVDVEIAAPGLNILSAKAGGGLRRLSGTSMACPHVAGVAALWWQAANSQGFPRTAAAVKGKLLANAKHDAFAAGVSLRDRGSGMVQAP